MKNNGLSGEILLEMQKEKGKTCVSVIVATHKLSPERQANPIEIKKAIKETKEYLLHNYKTEEVNSLINSIDELYNQIDFIHVDFGIGFFVSSGVQQLVHFSFPVTNKIIVGNSFEVRDLLYEMNYALPYYLLLLTEKNARLFEGRLNKLTEVKDNNFPQEYIEEYIYEHSVRGTSYSGHAFTKDFEKDKSVMEEIRYSQFFKKVDALLDNYALHNKSLLLASVSKELSSFKKVSKHADKIAAKIEGNFTYNDLLDLENKAWEKYKKVIDGKKVLLLKDYEEKIGTGLGIEGVEEVWKAAKAGRGYKLLVEKDFKRAGFIANEDDSRLYLAPPKSEHKILTDAVDDLIETVVEKNGEIVFMENDMLWNHHHIALITRY